MNMKTKLFAFAIVASFAVSVQAQTTLPACPNGTTTCNQSTQNMGDTSSSADDSQSEATQSNPSSNTNTSAGDIAINPSIQQSGNAVTQNGNSVQGGNATGGRADSYGNQSTNDNKSSASTGASTSGASNGNMTGLGGSASTGASSSGGNVMTGGTTSQGQSLAGGDQNASLRGGDQTSSLRGGNQETSLRGGDQTSSQNTSLKGANLGDVGSTSAAGAASSNEGNKTRSSADGSGNSRTTTGVGVDASDHSSRTSNYQDNSRFTVIPTVTQPTPASFSAPAMIGQVVGSCGPQMRVVHTPLDGFFFGFTGTKHIAKAAFTDTLEPVMFNGIPEDYRRVVQQDGTVILYGSQPILFTTVVNTSGARNLNLGGGSGGGNWGQAGGGVSSSFTRLVTQIILIDCEAQRLFPDPRTIIQEVPVKHIRQ